MKKLPTLSIIIPAYNEEDVIGGCLDAAIDQTIPADEIIVVDNKSTDSTASIVRSYQRKYPKAHIKLTAQSKEQGLVPTRDWGFKKATSEVYGRIDADSQIASTWVEAVKTAFADRDVMATTGPVRYTDMPARWLGLKSDDAVRKILDQAAKDHQFMFGSNMALRASAWELVRNDIEPDPDEQFHEDINLALYLLEKDVRVTYLSGMVGGMSARRINDNPKNFYSYIMRFERTFRHHDIQSISARMPIYIYLSIYFPARALYKVYNGEIREFSLNRLDAEIERRAKIVKEKIQSKLGSRTEG